MKQVVVLLLCLCTGISHAQIQVHSNHHSFQDKDGKPFFWMGDTAWELFHRLDRQETETLADQALIRSDKGTNYQDLVMATRDSAGSYVMVYLPQSKPVTIDVASMSGSQKRAWWFDPRTGKVINDREGRLTGSVTFTPPLQRSATQRSALPKATDWVLVIDDEAKKFPFPRR